MDRRRFLSLTLPSAAACAAFAVGCKKQREAKVPEVWDDAPVPGHAEAISKLAPPWPAPARAVIDNELLTFWLEEKGSPAMHVRLIFPTTRRSAIVVGSAAEYLRYELRRRLARVQVAVDVQHRPGRVEVGLHGRNEALPQALRWAGWALSRKDPSGALLAARQRLLKRSDQPTSEEVASAVLASRLLGLHLSNQYLDRKRIESVGRDALMQGWTTLTDPRRAVMVVHAGTAPADGADALARLAASWQGKGRAKAVESIIGRLRPKLAHGDASKNLMTDGSAPIIAAGGSTTGGVSLMLGRLIHTPNAKLRATARLAQRITQEEVDARVSMGGPHTLLAIHIPLAGRDVDKRAEAALTELGGFVGTRHPQQRLFAAAQLWLGARVVQSSLDGEDWTALWSESIDLADKDGHIPRALAVDATAMLAVEAQGLQAWQKKWFDPRAGAPGWQWVVAGADSQMLQRLSRLAPVESLQV